MEILARYYFFLEIATRLEYNAVQILATRFGMWQLSTAVYVSPHIT